MLKLPKASACTKCYSTDHPVWNCKNERACKVCRKPGHYEGTETCEHYCEDNVTRSFGGKEDVLSNFYPCKFHYKDVSYHTIEQAIQHQKAVISGCPDIADAIMQTKDPGRAKELSKCIKKNDIWDEVELHVYDDLCYAAATQNDEYGDALVDRGEQTLVEAVTGQFKWGSGLNGFATGRVVYEKLPGQNEMGKVHMRVREKLIDEQRFEDGFVIPKKSTPISKASMSDTVYIDNRYNVLCKGGDDEHDELEEEQSMSMMFGMGRGRGRGKRGRSPNSPGASSITPPPKQVRDGPTPPPRAEKKKHKVTKPNMSASMAQSQITDHFQNKTPGNVTEEEYDESMSPNDW